VSQHGTYKKVGYKRREEVPPVEVVDDTDEKRDNQIGLSESMKQKKRTHEQAFQQVNQKRK